MEVDAALWLAARSGRDGDVDRYVERLQQLPQGRCGAVAPDRSLSACERCGHEAAEEAGSAVADGVDTTVDAMQASASHSPRGRSSAYTDRFELPQRDHAVLSRGDSRYPSVGRVAFVPHEVTKATGARTRPLRRGVAPPLLRNFV